MIPQDTEPMPALRPVNRPPIIDLVGIWPQPDEPVVLVNKQCLDRNRFEVRVVDLDQDAEGNTDPLVAMWFLDPTLGSDRDVPIYRDPAPGQGARERFFELDWSNEAARPEPELLSIERPAVLELFVVESGALTPGFVRRLRDCAAEQWPESCVSTSPAVFRWTLQVKDEICP